MLKPLFLLFAVLYATSAVLAQQQTDGDPAEGIHQINQFLQTRWSDQQITPAADCNDESFARRLHLDLAGRIPTVQELQTFLQDRRPDKRQQLIRHLLQSEDYVQHFADNLDTLLMGRGSSRVYQQRQQNNWRAWLESVIRDNRAWDDCVRTILLARPQSETDRGAVWFLYERKDNYQKIAEELAPAFFGIRIECAQCHDHMVASEIEQRHYWGLVAFFNRGKNASTENGLRIQESAIGGFSEFANLEGDSSPNLLTFFQSATVPEERPESTDQQEDSDDFYTASVIDGEPRIPKFSRREAFVNQIAADHPLIARAFVNRIWALLTGRGIVHPFDEMDSAHPPSHPELLDWLAQDFRSSGYNIRRLVRLIVSSRVYQLDSSRPAGLDDPATFAWGLEKPLTAEQLARSASLALRGTGDSAAALLEPFRQIFPDLLPETVTTGVDDALFLSNNTAFTNYISESRATNHLLTRIQALPNVNEQASLAFRTVFGRVPTHEEVQRLQTYLNSAAANADSLSIRWEQVLWAMLTSAEFRFNH